MPIRKHVLAMAFPAFGHYIAMMELAKRIVPHHDVTVVISDTRREEIRQRHLVPPAPIGFHTVDDHVSERIDENFTDLRVLINIIESAKPYYNHFISMLNTDNSPLPFVDAIFCDITQHSPCDAIIAKGIPLYIVNVLPTFLMAKAFTIQEDTPTVPDETFFKDEVDGTKAADLPVQESIKTLAFGHHHNCKGARAMLFNSFAELEPGALEAFQQNPRTKDKILKYIGPLTTPSDSAVDNDGLAEKIMQWMDKQKERSVVYFSLGSIAVISKEQTVQIANALMSLNRPFVWSLRPFLQVHLPEGMKGQSADSFNPDSKYLIIPWTPQKRILSHKATALFVSHCGWNSTLETVSFGVPIVAWPMFGDQHFNAVLVEQVGIGLKVKGTGMLNKKAVPASEIVDAIETVAGWKSGDVEQTAFAKEMKYMGEKAREAVGENGPSTKSLLEILDAI
ncbi:uncharacterized protein LOC129602038 [Paramacrobiotus metropolitanus]|uniref:uncharacterized protein LOC129602038 n=1 Tax=Paramacrobiotus metropolitanus TaxID=2943436 RepID=UPI00244581B9|nr:uncharacterized protein LOC129602038 [Paramacrobiotus metropolitanus]